MEGIALRFIGQFYNSTLTEEGWIVDLLDEKDDKKFNKIPNVYDSAYYNSFVNTRDSLGLDSVLYHVPAGPVEVEIYFPRKISITYTKKRPEPEYSKKMGLPRNIPFLISYIDIREAIAIMENRIML